MSIKNVIKQPSLVKAGRPVGSVLGRLVSVPLTDRKKRFNNKFPLSKLFYQKNFICFFKQND